MTLRTARGGLRFCPLACALLGATLSARAGAATWADDRSTPHIRDLVAIDGTGETDWLFGAEDVAGDGLGRFDAAERALDVRSAYVAHDGRRLWLRAYVSSAQAPDAGLRVYFFIDADDDRRTGNHAVAPEIDPAFTEDGSDGGYDVVVGMQGATVVGSVWQWESEDRRFAPVPLPPLNVATESGTDTDPLRVFADGHGYVQAALDAAPLAIAGSCNARLLVRSSGADGTGDRDVGGSEPCVAADRDRNGVADLIEGAESQSCERDEQCPGRGLCVASRCLYPSYCRDDSECNGDEQCDDRGICRATSGGSCGDGSSCSGGLVCAASQCSACSDDASCPDARRCAASGRCVDERSKSGSSGSGDDLRLAPGEQVQGGAGTCALAPRTRDGAGWPWLCALVALGVLFSLRRGPRRSGAARGRAASLTLALGLLASPELRAQVDAERLKPAVTHDGWVNAEGSAVRDPADAWEFGRSLSYAYHPLIIADGDGELVDALVAGRLGLDLIGSVSLGERFALGLGVPLFAQHGVDSLSRWGMGDLRVVPKLELLDDVEDGVGLALAAELRLPTHSGDFSGGARGLTVFPKVILDHRYPGGLRIGMNAGVLVRKDQSFVNVTSGDELAYALGLAYRIGGLAGKTEIGLELNGAVGLAHPGDEEVALEALGFLRQDVGHEWQVQGGVGAGVLEGYGVPTWRIFLGATFTPTSHDADYDGVSDAKDQCAEFAEDRDGVLDADGCPEEDPDSDRDGVSDADDECPTSKETINGIQDEDGCPDAGDRRVVFDDGEFVVLDTIRFETGSSDIHPDAHSLLNQVALTLRANPEIEHLRIEGHTDDTGPREVNMALSERRALAVKHYLVQRGVSPKRLMLRSYGPDRPRETGTGNQARAKNRRVEFIIE
jgi:OmpA-OmpF porin, OOP family